MCIHDFVRLDVIREPLCHASVGIQKRNSKSCNEIKSGGKETLQQSREAC